MDLRLAAPLIALLCTACRGSSSPTAPVVLDHPPNVISVPSTEACTPLTDPKAHEIEVAVDVAPDGHVEPRLPPHNDTPPLRACLADRLTSATFEPPGVPLRCGVTFAVAPETAPSVMRVRAVATDDDDARLKAFRVASRREFERCFGTALHRGATDRGLLLVLMLIGKDGAVNDVQGFSRAHPDPELEMCLAGVLRKATFAPRAYVTEVMVPFRLVAPPPSELTAPAAQP